MGRGNHTESSASYRTKPMEVDFFSENGIKNVYISAGGSHSFSYSI